MTPLDNLIQAARVYTHAREAYPTNGRKAYPTNGWEDRIEEAGWKLAEATHAFDKSPQSSMSQAAE